MAFKLNKAELAQQAAHSAALQEKAAQVESKITAFNEIVEAWRGVIGRAVEEFNGARAEAVGWAQDIGNDRRSEWDDMSERWQEGDKGEAASAWIETFEDFDIDEMELGLDDVEKPDLLDECADELDALSAEPDA